MKIIRRHIFETNSSHGHSWHTDGVAYADTAPGEGSGTSYWKVTNGYALQKDIVYNLKMDANNRNNFISITSNLDFNSFLMSFPYGKLTI